MDMGLRIKELRIARQLTQAQLEKKVGISAPAMSMIESGRTKTLRGATLSALCETLLTNAVYLQTGKGSKGPSAIAATSERELLEIWGDLDDASRRALVITAQTLRGRQDDDGSAKEPPAPYLLTPKKKAG